MRLILPRAIVISAPDPAPEWRTPNLILTGASEARYRMLCERYNVKSVPAVIFINTLSRAWPLAAHRRARVFGPSAVDGFNAVICDAASRHLVTETARMADDLRSAPPDRVAAVAMTLASIAPPGPVWEIGAGATSSALSIGAARAKLAATGRTAAVAALDPVWSPDALALAMSMRHKVDFRTTLDSESRLLATQIGDLQA